MRHNRVGHLALTVVSALSIATVAVACSSSGSSTAGGSSSTGSSTGTTSIVVGSLPVIDTAGLQVALKEGFFKQAGLNVTVKPVTQSTAAIPDLLHGSIDVIAGGNYVSFLEADANGTFPVEILAPGIDCTTGTYGVVAMPSSGITRPADLAGKTIAVNLTQNIQTLTTSAVLSADGVSASSLHYVQVPFPDMVAALQAGRVNAISVVEPFLAAALAAGGRLVTSTCSGTMAGFPLSGYETTQSWVQQHEAAAHAFQQALEKGNAYADANPSVVRSLLPTYTSITAKAAASMPLGTYPGTLTASSIQRVVTLMRGGGLATPSDVTSLIFS
ncbi:MAG TPA: ABC transporter substrate-binding protein [Trebonia sp.]|nr:ABC transporter substrate-binding protein [Trebonia sp.]